MSRADFLVSLLTGFKMRSLLTKPPLEMMISALVVCCGFCCDRHFNSAGCGDFRSWFMGVEAVGPLLKG